MPYIILFIFTIVILWIVVSKILTSIEDYIIRKSKVKEELKNRFDSINNEVDKAIIETKDNYSSLRKFAIQSFPDLNELMIRDNRKREYINNYLPYKRINKKRKR